MSCMLNLTDIFEFVINRFNDVFYELIDCFFIVLNFISYPEFTLIYTGQVIRANKKTINVAELRPPCRQWKIDANFLIKKSRYINAIRCEP